MRWLLALAICSTFAIGAWHIIGLTLGIDPTFGEISAVVGVYMAIDYLWDKVREAEL